MFYRSYRAIHPSPRLVLLGVILAAILVIGLQVALLRHIDRGGSDLLSSERPSPSGAGTGSAVRDTDKDPIPSGTGADAAQPSDPGDATKKLTEIPWNLVLVNAGHPLPEGFTPQLAELSNGYYFDERAIGALREMLDACREAGLSPVVCSAYRSIDHQTRLFENKIDSFLADGLSYDEARAAAATIVAYPGHSEHNLGLAVDIYAASHPVLDESQENTAEQQWLMAHCHEYGFILRYLEDKSPLTGIIYEPWHYRYVGVEAATEIMTTGICLEEYMDKYYVID